MPALANVGDVVVTAPRAFQAEIINNTEDEMPALTNADEFADLPDLIPANLVDKPELVPAVPAANEVPEVAPADLEMPTLVSTYEDMPKLGVFDKAVA